MADPIVTVQDGQRTWTARAARPSDRGEAVALCVDLWRTMGRQFRRYLAASDVENSAEGFARDIARIHVVRLDPVGEPGPPPQRADLLWVWPALVIGGYSPGRPSADEVAIRR